MTTQELLTQLKSLPTTEQEKIVYELLDTNDYFLGYNIVSKDSLVDELVFRVENATCEDENAQEIQMFIETYDTEEVFEILQDCCNGNYLRDYTEWNERDEDILNYVDFDEDEFVAKIYPLNTQARRDKKLEELLA